MDGPKFKETIGVNEVIRRPPYPGSPNDLESMARLEGQAYGDLGAKPRPWLMIAMMYLAFGGPIFSGVFFYLLFGYGDWEMGMRAIMCPLALFMAVITHIPIYQAILTKVTS